MIPKNSKIMGMDDSIIDELYKTFMRDNMPPDIMKNMNPNHEYIFKGIFMAGAQATTAIIESMEKANVPDHVGDRTYGVMVKSCESQMLGNPFSIDMSVIKIPSPSEVH